MSAPVKRQKPPGPPRPPNRRRWITPSDEVLDHDLDHYRFDLLALTLLFRGLSDAMRLARMQEIARQRSARRPAEPDAQNNKRPMEREDLVAYG